MKRVIFLMLIGAVLAGCSRNPFSPELPGIGFWETPNVVESTLNDEGLLGLSTNCFSSFMVLASRHNWNEFEFVRKVGMGIAPLMAQRVVDYGHESLVQKEDLKRVSWSNNNPERAEGEFEFDSFYGNGRVLFKAMKINGEWVISYMAIPRKGKADDDGPYVVFDLSEDEVAKLMQ